MKKADIYNKISNTDLRKEKLILATVLSSETMDYDFFGEKVLLSSENGIFTTLENENLLKKIKKEFEKNEDIFEKDKSEIIKIDDKIELLLDPIHDEPRLVIFGSGHVAQPLAKIAKIAGFTVNVIDDREGLLNRGYFPTADSLIAREYNSFLEEYQARADDYIVIVTRGHQHDYDVLKEVIDSSAKYIGMIGSNHKVKLTFEQLKEEKEVSQEKIDEVDAPIGINLGSETPAEIAVSIMSKIISVRRGQNEA